MQQEEKTLRDKISTPAMSAAAYAGRSFLVLCIVYCTIGVVVSAFNFDIDMIRLLYSLLIIVPVITIVSGLSGIKGMGILLIPAAAVLIWDFSRISGGFMMTVNAITARYSRWTPVQEMFPESTEHLSDEIGVFFIACAVVITFLIVITACFMSSTALTVLVTLPVVMLSFVLVETPPDADYLIVLITSYIAMVFADGIFPDSTKKSAAIIIPVFILAAVFTAGIYLITPPHRYERADHTSSIRAVINNIGQTIFRTFTGIQFRGSTYENSWIRIPNTGIWLFSTNRVNVADASQRVITDQGLLEVQISDPGAYYIRGFALGDFNGREWLGIEHEDIETRNYDEMALSMPALITSVYSRPRWDAIPQDDDMPGQMVERNLPVPDMSGINIRRLNDVTVVDYKPYYSYDASMAEMFARPPRGYDTGFYYVPEPEDFRAFSEEVVMLTLREADIMRYGALSNKYRSVDPDTEAGLRAIAADAGIDITAERAEIADAVAEYIMAAGTYTLSPPQIPYDVDFALYFLQESRQGYCIHYATVATLMLRALDVPARFVSGYVTTVRPHETNSVLTLTDRDAHAWVEVLYEDIGWIPLEVTPGGGPQLPADQTPEYETPVPEPTIPPVTPPPFTPDTDTQTPLPAQDGSDDDVSGNRQLPEWAVNIIFFAACFAAPIIVIITRRKILIGIRNRKFMQKDTNAAVIYIWKYIKKVCRGYADPPDEIEALALKARFSQHRISEEEREQMIVFYRKLVVRNENKMEDFERFMFRYIRALG